MSNDGTVPGMHSATVAMLDYIHTMTYTYMCTWYMNVVE